MSVLDQQNNLKLENLTDTELHRLNARHPRDGTGRQRLGAGIPPKMANAFALTRPTRLFANAVFAFKIAPTSKNKRRKPCAALYLRASADWN
jgi:hypothetical protein